LARHGCRVLETGEREQADKVRQKEEQRFESSLDETVERVLSTAGSDAVAQACNEVAAGFTAEVVRN
jgi:MOSC domain-containing protein YiiM